MTDSRAERHGRGAAGLLVAALMLATTATVHAQDLEQTVTFFLPAGTLVMPFDNTANHASFQIVTRLGPGLGSGPIATHWSYWAEDCRHLVDVFVCLTPGDTKVMDPSKVQGEIQSPNPPTNNGIGSVSDLTGERGLVTVTAFEASTGGSGLECNVLDPEGFLTAELVGGWVIADTATNAAFGADAIGLAPDALPEATAFVVDTGIVVQTFNPQSLGASQVIVLSLEVPAGSGIFAESEMGPIQRERPDGNHVCCNISFTDNLEITTSLPDLCFDCADFRPISALQAENGEASIIPPNTSIDAPGFVRIRNCQTATGDGDVDDLGADFEQFLFAVHGQAIGPFGVAVYGKYTGEQDL